MLISGWRGEAASARLLTLGAEPQQFTVLPKQYMRFEVKHIYIISCFKADERITMMMWQINLINDYCAKPTVRS